METIRLEIDIRHQQNSKNLIIHYERLASKISETTECLKQKHIDVCWQLYLVYGLN